MVSRRALGLLLATLALTLAAFAVASLPGSAYTTAGGSGDITIGEIDAVTDLVTYNATSGAYEVNDTLVISPGDRLVLTAGTHLQFADSTSLVIEGGLDARGNASAHVRLGGLPGGSMLPATWYGILANGSSRFVIDFANITDSVDFGLANVTGAVIRNVAYEGRLIIDNSTTVWIENITMTALAADPGRVALWIEGSSGITVRGAVLTPGSGWATEVIEVENSQSVLFQDLVERVDSFQLRGIDARLCSGLRVEGWTFTQGPTLGDPNTALELTDCTDVWVERLTMTHVGEAGQGAIYGTRSNLTVANSTFPPGMLAGAWRFPGHAVGVNATRLPVTPTLGAEVWEYELVEVQAQWSAGGLVADANASLSNASFNASGHIVSGHTQWLWLLREVNLSGAVQPSADYSVRVTCNCTEGTAAVTLVDDWGARITVQVGDASPPEVRIVVSPFSTTGSGFLDAANSSDNAGIAAFLWNAVGTVNASGLPCAAASCAVTFFEPGTFMLEVTVTDRGGLSTTRRVSVQVADTTAPVVAIAAVTPARPGQSEPFAVEASAFDNDPAFLPLIEWYLDGARATGDTLTGSFSLAALGSHTVRIVVRDDAGNAAEASATVEVRDSTAPHIGLWAAQGVLRAPATLELNGSVATDNVGVVSWRWRVVGEGTDYSLTGSHPNATLPAAGTYNVTLTALDAEGNSASRTFTLSVAGPSPGATPLGGLDGIFIAFAVVIGAAGVLLMRKRSRDPEEPAD